jgi:hypothetical protein
MLPGMAAIFLRYSDGQVTERSEDEVKRLWDQGLLPGGSIYYWQNGMLDWKLLVDWLGPQPQPQEVAFGQEYHFTIDPTDLTRMLKRLFRVALGLNILIALLDFVTYFRVLFKFATPGNTGDHIELVLGFFQLIVGFTAGFVFLKWLYRAYKNIQGFGAKDLKYSPVWAVIYYFIPILCLFRPVNVISEIWRASVDPMTWRQQKASSIIGIWWGVWLFYSLLMQISLEFVSETNDLKTWRWTGLLDLVSDLLAIVLVWLTLQIVNRIYEHQRKLVTESAE